MTKIAKNTGVQRLKYRLRHECIVPLLAFSVDAASHASCLVMPRMDGSLGQLLQDAGQRDACGPAQRVQYACDIFAGLAYLQKPVFYAILVAAHLYFTRF